MKQNEVDYNRMVLVGWATRDRERNLGASTADERSTARQGSDLWQAGFHEPRLPPCVVDRGSEHQIFASCTTNTTRQ